MARAKRHYISGYLWHITHRCHKRKFLLKFSKDRHRYLQWLYQARKRYGLCILNYMVNSNHIHLLVADAADRGTVARRASAEEIRADGIAVPAMPEESRLIYQNSRRMNPRSHGEHHQ